MQKTISSKKLDGTFFFSIIALFVVFFDQFLKYKTRLSDEFYFCNKGISFGILLPRPALWLIFGIFFVFIAIYLIYLYKNNPVLNILLLGIALFAGGVFSNFIDRILFGCVLDHIVLFKKFFFVFNFADIALFLGIGLIIFFFIPKNKAACV